MDICFPKKNPEKFISIAKKLEKKELYLVYPYQKNISRLRSNIDKLQKKTNTILKLGLLASPKDIIKAKKLSDFIITESTSKDQHVLEKLKPSLIFNLEKSPKKDRPHYRYSGLNQVLCKLAAKNNVVIGFAFSELLNSSKKPIIMGRMMQNIRFCKKYNCKVLIGSFAKSPFELRSDKQLQSIKRLLER
ncbi:hypothetical protein GF361_01255 [Candidatus Woesearchaeota archaeon]|nr:hypothetical protein [Candidatus Woesearchaeota archaeon]